MIGAVLRRLMRRDRVRDALVPLYNAVVATARRPVWYRSGGVPDTIDGRFDMVAAILALVLIRLEREGEAGREPAARLAEIFVADMDGQLRQQGVGDLVVGKHVGRMMGALGGRLAALREGLSGGDSGGNMDRAIARNILRTETPDPAQLGLVRDGLVALSAALGATPAHELIEGEWSR